MAIANITKKGIGTAINAGPVVNRKKEPTTAIGNSAKSPTNTVVALSRALIRLHFGTRVIIFYRINPELPLY